VTNNITNQTKKESEDSEKFLVEPRDALGPVGTRSLFGRTKAL